MPAHAEPANAASGNAQIVLATRPVDLPGRAHVRIEPVDLPHPLADQVQVRVDYAALSPWQGQRMKDFKNYTTPFQIGEVIDCDVLGTVVARGPDLTAGFEVGQTVTGRLGWRRYAAASPAALQAVGGLDDPTLWLTALSSPGLTAYTALDLFGRCLPGQTMVVTSAAGAVGGYAVQLGKLAGMTVIGIAGGPEKCAYVEQAHGADRCLDHRAADFAEQLAETLVDGAHQVFDTTGGPITDHVYEHLAKHARVLIVGRTASNNSATPASDPVNMRQLWAREATVHGFSRYSYPERWAFARDRMFALCQAGKIRASHHVVKGFENTPDTLGAMLSGRFFGKVLVQYHDATGPL